MDTVSYSLDTTVSCTPFITLHRRLYACFLSVFGGALYVYGSVYVHKGDK